MLNQTTIFINLFITFGSLMTIYIGIKNVNNFSQVMNFIYHFCIFLNEKNPLIFDYSELNPIDLSHIEIGLKKHVVIYEDKYLEKFKKFPNEFTFSDSDLDLERKHYEELKSNKETNFIISKNKIEQQLLKIKYIYENGNINQSETELYFLIDGLNDFGKQALISYFDLNEDEDDIDLEELLLDLTNEKLKLEDELSKLEELYNLNEEEEMKNVAHQFIINNKLDSYIDNYVLEYTPLGNIYMRYNNNKKSFEYFSNNTIPYRYLEPVGRKYVMTYWCKPIFVDIEEELKKSEERQKLEEEGKKNELEPQNKSKQISKFQNYNKEINNSSTMRQIQKNRPQTNMVLPPHIMSNVKSSNENKLLKEKANRYTWEGRLSNFSPLKMINKKIVNKNLSLSFADFKKMSKK